MERQSDNFATKVANLIAQIPYGKVMTYGQVALLCGSPRAARIVGGVAHFGDPDLPWHRLVNKNGGMAKGFSFGGPIAQKKLLHEEGVVFDDKDTLNIDTYRWSPDE